MSLTTWVPGASGGGGCASRLGEGRAAWSGRVVLGLKGLRGRARMGDQDIRIIERLLAMPEQSDLHPRLSAILNAGSKGSFEQEAVPIDEVWKALGFA